MANVGKGTPGDPDHGWALYIVSVIMVILSGIFVMIRVAVRTSKKMMGADDWIIVAGLVSLIFLSLTESLAVVNGYGMHEDRLSHPRIEEAFKWFYGAQITYKIAVCLYKESILFLYLRIFTDKRFRMMTYTLIGLVTASGIAFTIVTVFQCQPVSAFWDKSILKSDPGSRCFNSEAFWFSYALVNIFLDILILILPIHEVMKLQLPIREKAELVAVFSLGIFVCATSIIRTTTLAASSKSPDASWGYIPATVWSVVEANTGTICACLPMLKQPLSQFFPRLFGSNGRSSLGHSPGDYPLASKSKKNTRPAYSANAKRNSTDYHQWAMSDGTIVSPTTKNQGHGGFGRESEERMVGRGQGIKVTRTTDVNNVYASGDSDSIPSLKEQVYSG